jgi:hypothetical protein
MIRIEDIVTTKKEDIDVKKLMGWRYSLPNTYIRAQDRLPNEYDLSRLKLVDYSRSDRKVYWPEVQMILQLCRSYTPIGWKLIQTLVYDNSYMPVEWIEHLSGGGEIVFPHAVCYKRNEENIDTIVCGSIDCENREIECYGISLGEIKQDMRIAVYQ